MKSSITAFLIVFSVPVLASLSSVADSAFLENADQFQESEGVDNEDFYIFKREIESQAPFSGDQAIPGVRQVTDDDYNVRVENRYLPPVVERNSDTQETAPKPKKSFGYSFSDMAKKTQKKQEKKSLGFTFSNLADSIQKGPTQNLEQEEN